MLRTLGFIARLIPSISVLLLGLVAPSYGQSVAGAPEVEPAPDSDPRSAFGLARGAPPTGPLFQWGWVGVRPRAEYRTSFADGLQLLAGRPVSTWLDTYTAGIALELGQKWRIDYSPSWVKYSNPGFRDSVNHALSADGQITKPNWSVDLSQRYTSSDTVRVETGRQTKTQYSSAQAGITRRVGERLIARFVLEQDLSFLEGLADTYKWSFRHELSGRIASDFQVGGGIATGYVLRYDTSDMFYHRPTVQLAWMPSQKFALTANGGLDRWEFVSGKLAPRTGLYVAGSARYQPFTHSTAMFTLGRGLDASPFQDQTSESSEWSLKVRQRVLRHFHVDLGMEQQSTRYVAGIGGVLSREDDLRSFDIRLTTQILRRFTFSGSYRRTKNRSNVPGFDFAGDQIGFQIGLRY